MTKIIAFLILLFPYFILGQDNAVPLFFTINNQQGVYIAQAKHNDQATPEQKEAFNTELHKLGGEVLEKIKLLLLNNKAILDLKGNHPIITVVCQWNNVEIKVEPASQTNQ